MAAMCMDPAGTRRLAAERANGASPRSPLAAQLERKDLVEGLRSDPACRALSDAHIEELAGSARRHFFKCGELVLRRGAAGSRLYVLASGSLQVVHEGQLMRTLHRGHCVGAASLASNCAEPLDVVAQEAVVLWGVDGSVFARVLAECSRRSAADSGEFLQRISLFQSLPAWVRGRMQDVVPYVQTFEAGEVIHREGEPDVNQVRVLRRGEVVLHRSDGDLEDLQSIHSHVVAGDVLGSGSCLPWQRGRPLVATGVATRRSQVICVPWAALVVSAGGESALAGVVQRTMIVMGLGRLRALSGLSPAGRARIAQAMEIREHSPGELIDTSCSCCGARYVQVLQGSVCKSVDGRTATKRLGHIFLAPRFFQEREREGAQLDDVEDVLTAGPDGCKVAVLTKRGLARACVELGVCLVDSLEDAADLAEDMLLERRAPAFRHLSNDQVQLVLGALVPRQYAQGATVVEQGEVGCALFLVASGVLEVRVGGKAVRTLSRGGSFGDRALLFEEPRTATVAVISEGGAQLWCLHHGDFTRILSPELRAELARRAELQDTAVELKDLDILREIGSGGFGRVTLVEHRHTGLRYALKEVHKRPEEQHSEAPTQAERALQEAKLLAESCDHPMALQLVRAMETPRIVYLLTEVVTGGDLHDAILRLGRPFCAKEAAFYAGSLVQVLQHLHDRDVVHRDVKPENVMLDGAGYIKLIDFGVAKRLDCTGRTFTRLGTPHYMAPEVFLREGYGCEIDTWAVGVVLYLFVCRSLPFSDGRASTQDIQKRVVKEQLTFPNSYRDPCGRDLIGRLLAKRPECRLGAGMDGLGEVKMHPFFAMQSGESLFDKLIRRELPAPIIPGGSCFTNFDEPDCHSAGITATSARGYVEDSRVACGLF